MPVWLIIVGAGGTVLYWNGSASLSLARRGKLVDAARSARCGGLAAAIIAMIGATLVWGWPFYRAEVSVPVEIHRTVVEAVEVPIQVTRWIFWKRTVMTSEDRERDVVETTFQQHIAYHFSFWLLIGLLVIGGLAYFSYRGCFRLWWVWYG